MSEPGMYFSGSNRDDIVWAAVTYTARVEGVPTASQSGIKDREQLSKAAKAVLQWWDEKGVGQYGIYSRVPAKEYREAKSFVITSLGLGFFARLFFPFIFRTLIKVMLVWLNTEGARTFRESSYSLTYRGN